MHVHAQASNKQSSSQEGGTKLHRAHITVLHGGSHTSTEEDNRGAQFAANQFEGQLQKRDIQAKAGKMESLFLQMAPVSVEVLFELRAGRAISIDTE